MKKYLIPFIVYISVFPICNFFIQNENISYAIKVIASILTLGYFYKDFGLKLKLNVINLVTGIIAFLLWIGLDNIYKHIGTQSYVPIGGFDYVVKFLGLLIAAPFIEELFVRDFLNRYVISQNWKKVKIGEFSTISFVFTVLFFGFAHSRWLSGIITAVLYNLLLIRTKKIEDCIIAHLITNFLLGVFVVMNQAWYFW